MSKEKKIDWSILNLPGVQEVAENAARKISDQYELTLEYDDAFQEAVIILASRPEEVAAYVVGGHLGQLHHWLHQRLAHLVETEAKHRAKHVSRERLIESNPE